tara:strand:+ start:338 stop:472 length:135 start_codon:yes stop_codon:yes gene_type:complete
MDVHMGRGRNFGIGLYGLDGAWSGIILGVTIALIYLALNPPGDD